MLCAVHLLTLKLLRASRSQAVSIITLGKFFITALGFASGWISLLVGFAGAISAVAIAIGEYAHELVGIPVKIIAVTAIVVVSCIHWFGVRTGGIAQNILTSLKLVLIVVFCIAPFFISGVSFSNISFFPQAGDGELILSAGFAISLVYVVYAYTGWNAAAYIAGNLEEPEKNLPRSLIIGTLVVVLVYLSLNGTFLFVATFAELDGKNDIGNIVAFKLFGVTIGSVFCGLVQHGFAFYVECDDHRGSSRIRSDGRRLSAIKDIHLKKSIWTCRTWLSLCREGGSIFLVIVERSFKEIIQYISVSLSVFSMLTVIGIFIVRKKFPDSSFRLPLYPLPPIFFIAVTCWMIYFEFTKNPMVIFYSAGTILSGFACLSMGIKEIK